MAGDSIAVLSEASVRVMSFGLDLLVHVPFPSVVDFIYVNEAQPALLLTYHSSTLSVFNLHKSLSTPLTHLEIPYIASVRTLTIRTPKGHRDYIFSLTKQGRVCANQTIRISTEQVAEMELLHGYLVLLLHYRDTVEVYKPKLQLVKLYKRFSFNPPLMNIIPTQEKLIAVHMATDSLAVGFFKYTLSKAFYSLPISLSRVNSLSLHGSQLILQAASQKEEPCLLVISTSRLYPVSQLNDYNAVLRKPIIVEIPVPPPVEEKKREVRRHSIENKRQRKNKGRHHSRD
jgi:hypothetical protein